MKLVIDGNINPNDVQEICMIFFPGEKFGVEAQEVVGAPDVYVRVEELENGASCYCIAKYKNKETTSEKFVEWKPEETRKKIIKQAVGFAMVSALGDLMHYRPSWGMLTGVRPSRLTTDLYKKGYSRARVRRTMVSEYMVSPKKASLATDITINEQKVLQNLSPLDCSLYLSIPFCPTRCSYCSFVSYTTPKLLSLIPDYLNKLIEDFKKNADLVKELGLNMKTVYIGGGTPSILSAEQLKTLLSVINEKVDVSSLEEFTVEAGRPDTITKEKIQVLKDFGVNRVCVNPQSLCPTVLEKIGRTHSPEQFEKAFAIVREVGIPIINTDLIAGLPGDTFKTFSETFDRIMELSPENVTVHTFCVKKASEILRNNSGIFNMRGGDTGKCIDYSQLQADANGYIPYYMYRQKNSVGNFENVGFAKAGFEGKYNIYMMEEIHSIFASGAGAVTKLVSYNEKDPSKTKIERLFYPKYPYEYLEDNSFEEKAKSARAFYENLKSI